ncbi:hypothetical protein RI054_11g57200 [Pseudoscourfieldia marina]
MPVSVRRRPRAASPRPGDFSGINSSKSAAVTPPAKQSTRQRSPSPSSKSRSSSKAAPKKKVSAPATPKVSASHVQANLYAKYGDVLGLVALLASGTNLSILGQYVADVPINKAAQLHLLVQFLVQLVVLIPRMLAASSTATTKAKRKVSTAQAIHLAFISIFYVAGFALSFAAVPRAGTALNQVVYSTSIIVMAALSYAVLGRVPTTGQGVGMAIAFAGVAVASQKAFRDAFRTLSGKGGSGDVGIGLALSVAMTLSFNVSTVLLERMHRMPRTRHAPLSSAFVQLCQVSLGVLALASYVCVMTIPRWNEYVTAPLAKEGWTLKSALLLYAFNGVCSLAHSQIYISVARGGFGANGTGLVNALRTATVSVAAHLFFCDANGTGKARRSCLDHGKVTGALLIAAGGTTYVLNKENGKKKRS